MSTEKKRFRNRTNHSMCIFIEALSLVNSLKVFKVCGKLYIPPLTDLESLIKKALYSRKFVRDSTDIFSRVPYN